MLSKLFKSLRRTIEWETEVKSNEFAHCKSLFKNGEIAYEFIVRRDGITDEQWIEWCKNFYTGILLSHQSTDSEEFDLGKRHYFVNKPINNQKKMIVEDLGLIFKVNHFHEVKEVNENSAKWNEILERNNGNIF